MLVVKLILCTEIGSGRWLVEQDLTCGAKVAALSANPHN